MSSLKWEPQSRVIAGTNGRLLETYWELWDANTVNPREWYHSPHAVIVRLGPRRWQLDAAPDDFEVGRQIFSTFKAAKAMGIALTKLKD